MRAFACLRARREPIAQQRFSRLACASFRAAAHAGRLHYHGDYAGQSKSLLERGISALDATFNVISIMSSGRVCSARD
jgi:hypothetical protein